MPVDSRRISMEIAARTRVIEFTALLRIDVDAEYYCINIGLGQAMYRERLEMALLFLVFLFVHNVPPQRPM